MQLRKVLEQRYPGLEIVGTNYPPTAAKALASKAASTASLGVIAATLAGEKIFPFLGMAIPPFVLSLQENKMGSVMGAWFVGNLVSQNLISTGAFEVFYDGKEVFSKLKTGDVPQLPLIVRQLDAVIGGSPPPLGGAARAAAAAAQQRVGGQRAAARSLDDIDAEENALNEL